MKIIAISDTHGQHKGLKLPDGDMIIHAGDISSRGREEQVMDFLEWFTTLDFKYKIFIAGNHDFFFEKESLEKIAGILPDNVIYLNDSGITIEGIKIWGSPITPWFHDWAFNRARGSEIKKHWDLIPSDTDIIITHGPVRGMHDKTITGANVGCEDLYKKVFEIKPRYHICGHIHEAYGDSEQQNTTFINASMMDEKYRIVNQPVIFFINNPSNSKL